MQDARDEQGRPRAIPTGPPAAAAYLPTGHGVEVVGDFYDLFETGGQWWAVMGDVCGHDIEAAKLTALACYTIRTEAAHLDATPSEVLHRLHAALLAQHGRTKVATAAVACLRPGPGGVIGTLCSAGHEPALIRRARGGIDVPPTRGRPLRMTHDVDLHDITFTLGHGDALVLYTDGVTEARAVRRRPARRRTRPPAAPDRRHSHPRQHPAGCRRAQPRLPPRRHRDHGHPRVNDPTGATTGIGGRDPRRSEL
jgi:hypothetical protein